VLAATGLVAVASIGVAVEPPCTSNRYGSITDAVAIEDALIDGHIVEARAAILAARATRGVEVGCPEAVFERQLAATQPPSLDEVRTLWRTVHAPTIGDVSACPPLGRTGPAAALGAWLAGLAGEFIDSVALGEIVEAARWTQVGSHTVPAGVDTWPGLFGYGESLADPGSDCHHPGVVADGIAFVCGTLPSLCPVYDSGPWAGQRFVVGDISREPRYLDGGAAYDHGWTASMMLEASLAHPDDTVRRVAAVSFHQAALWSRDEPAVRNHNYTAKNIWVLAQAYGLSGDREFRRALLDRLGRSLLPGVLMDLDGDGFVDGQPGIEFVGLADVARHPGRMWDAHNSLAWYQAMNAWAMVEAYVAFRDRGDAEPAAVLRPYALAMLDNLAAEILELGPARDLGPEVHPIPFALGIGLWKLARAENLDRTRWEQALWAIWHTGYFDDAGARTTANAGLLLVVRGGVGWTPSDLRAPPTAPRVPTGRREFDP
jgi:hypothetical protein